MTNSSILLGAIFLGVWSAAVADEIVLPAAPGSFQDFTMSTLQMEEEYRLGVEKYRLDHETRVTGWQVSENWFFGHQKGEDSGLTLVWQQDREQVSLSKDGVRFTRRF
jgi:hypothetical protein|tara:strand:+ start:1117 stop:1440 length:324 start_codon:yes stop_codon:yes gene_type:complete